MSDKRLSPPAKRDRRRIEQCAPVSLLPRAALALLPLLGGCGVYECIDARFEREPRPVEQTFSVVLDYEGTRHQRDVQCEEYYDAMCAERGNYWSTRQVGTASRYDNGAFHVTHERLGPLTIPLPSCTDMTSGRDTPLDHLVISAGGNNHYRLIASDGDLRTYEAMPHASKPGEIVRIRLSMRVNGRALEQR
jgi:hypothetical protein